MSVEVTIELIGSKEVNVFGETYPVSESNILRYAAVKRRAASSLLKKFRSQNGIVVKAPVKKEPVKEATVKKEAAK